VKAEWDPVRLTQALVRIGGMSGAEGGVADIVENAMKANGFRDVVRDELGDVIGFAGPEQDTSALLFDAHMDVVPPKGLWTVPPFGGDIIDGRIFGRGSCDMKGALAAAICGVGDAARSGGLKQQIVVSASVLEETIEGLALARVIDRAKPAKVVICEPSSLSIKHGQRGRIEILVEARGKPAHAAHPERGVNPILLAAQAIATISSMKLPRHEVLGDAIMVPTDIVSNPYPSISLIPESVTVRYDRRIVVGEDADTVLDEIRHVLARIDPHAYVASISRGPVVTYTGKEVDGDRYLAAWLFAKNTPLADAAAAALRESGADVHYGVYAFCTNGSECAGQRRIETIGLGPGAEADAHTADESVSIDEVLLATAAYRSICLRIAGEMR
jgi:putative selenium metabolism hydrolase